MATAYDSAVTTGAEKNIYSKDDEKHALDEPHVVLDGVSLGSGQDLLGTQNVDSALDAKMHIVNNVRRLP